MGFFRRKIAEVEFTKDCLGRPKAKVFAPRDFNAPDNFFGLIGYGILFVFTIGGLLFQEYRWTILPIWGIGAAQVLSRVASAKRQDTSGGQWALWTCIHFVSLAGGLALFMWFGTTCYRLQHEKPPRKGALSTPIRINLPTVSNPKPPLPANPKPPATPQPAIPQRNAALNRTPTVSPPPPSPPPLREDKPVDLKALAQNRAAWPSELTLNKDVEFQIRSGGTISGAVVVPVGSTVRLNSVEEENVVVVFSEQKARIPIEWTDLINRVRKGAR